jgi:hypothetical protein
MLHQELTLASINSTFIAGVVTGPFRPLSREVKRDPNKPVACQIEFSG